MIFIISFPSYADNFTSSRVELCPINAKIKREMKLAMPTQDTSSVVVSKEVPWDRAYAGRYM